MNAEIYLNCYVENDAFESPKLQPMEHTFNSYLSLLTVQVLKLLSFYKFYKHFDSSGSTGRDFQYQSISNMRYNILHSFILLEYLTFCS